MAKHAPSLLQFPQIDLPLHEWPRAPGFASVPLELALIVLDRFGIVDNCNAAAGKLFGAALPTLLGQHVNRFIPGMPLRHRTPGYNLAYAAFWSGQPRYRRFTGMHCRGNPFELDVRLDRLALNGNPLILLDVKQAESGAREREYPLIFAPFAQKLPAC